MRVALILTLLVALTGCAQMRRNAYLKEWPNNEWAYYIKNGLVTQGMNSYEVQASWGKPVRKDFYSSPLGNTTWWHYHGGLVRFANGNIVEAVTTW